MTFTNVFALLDVSSLPCHLNAVPIIRNCVLGSGNTVIKAVNVLQEHAVEEENIILLNLFSTPAAARTITSAFPKVRISLHLIFMQIQNALKKEGEREHCMYMKLFGNPSSSCIADEYLNIRGASCGTKPLWTEVFWHRLKNQDLTAPIICVVERKDTYFVF